MSPIRIGRSAFTLAELLVAMAVLSGTILLLASLFNSSARVTSSSSKRIDADAQARICLNRMAADIAAMVKRTDVDYHFAKNTGNDEFAFYSEAPGYYPSDASGVTPKSPVTLSGYRVINNQLERLNKALVWNGVPSAGKPMVFLPQMLAATWPNIVGGGTDEDYQVLGDQVYRFEFCFLMRDGTLSAQPWLAPKTSVDGFRDVRAIVAAIAVLDSKSRAIVSDWASAAAELEDVSGTSISTTPAELWHQKIQNRDLGLPAVAASQVRIYQQYFAVRTDSN